ncbi:MAG: hypothetical protein P1U68_02770 [Verrucomicrobiales bacterium]|nr:hypothetical protein [Verrucomicrobiales bacterium]
MNQDPDKPSATFTNQSLKWLMIVLALFLLIEIPLLISHARHAYFKIDGWFAFYAILGFAACILLVFSGRALSGLIRRSEDHYGIEQDESLPEDLDEQLR